MLQSHLIVRTRPVANAKNIVLWGSYRITVLQDRLFRIERNPNKKFRDDATQKVWFRDMPEQAFTVMQTERELTVDTGACKLIVKPRRNDCRIVIDGKEKRISNEGNLRGTYRTLDCWNGPTYCRPWIENDQERRLSLGNGVCSATGVALFHDEKSLTLGIDGEVKPARGEGTDEYVFAYGNDYRSAVRALYLISGDVPMIPRYALGNWWSRYHAYTDKEYLRLLNAFEEHDVPLTVATIDMDWHYSNNEEMDEEFGITASGLNEKKYVGPDSFGWTGYTWNKHLFPDHKAFLKKIKEKNLKITLNVHPADGVRFWDESYEQMAQAVGIDPQTKEYVPFDIASANFVNHYFSVLHKPQEEDGVEFWWIDWQQGENSGIEGLDPLWALNHYHYLDSAKNHTVPMILSRYAEIGSHRYPLGFSGDTYVTWETLGYLPYFTLTASNVGYTWWSHDIGGHMCGEHSDELFTRHVQFGVFSPVNRLHGSCNPAMTKEPWVYRKGAGKIIEEFLRLRHALIPYLYSCAYRTHSEGLALIEPLYYYHDCKEAYEYRQEYYFGGQLLVAPVTTKAKKDGYARVKVWLPEGEWTDIFTQDTYRVGEGGRELTLLRTLDEMPVFAKAGAILPLSKDKGNSVCNPENLEINVFGGNGEYVLYEDGSADGKEGRAFTRFTAQRECGKQTLIIKAEDEGVIPAGRTLTVRMRSIPEGEVVLYVDGVAQPTEEMYTQCAAVTFPMQAGKEYRIEVTYAARTQVQELIDRARYVLTRSEDDYAQMEREYARFEKAASVEEFVALVEKSKLKEVVRQRLLEVV